MNKIFKLLALFTLLITSTSVYAQKDSVINHNIKALQKYAALDPVEKVHLHLIANYIFRGIPFGLRLM